MPGDDRQLRVVLRPRRELPLAFAIAVWNTEMAECVIPIRSHEEKAMRVARGIGNLLRRNRFVGLHSISESWVVPITEALSEIDKNIQFMQLGGDAAAWRDAAALDG
jgi:hypothetical protein